MKISGALRRGRKLPLLLLVMVAALSVAGIVRADDGDAGPPTISAFAITPPTVNTYPSGGGVDFHAAIDDDVSGVASASITFHDANGDPASTATLSNDGGDDYTASEFIYPGNEGTWTIDSIDVADNDGNTMSYATDDLDGMGYPTTFDVVNQAPAPSVSDFEPTSGAVGDPVTITGTSFTGATEVDFNGTAATSMNVDSDTQITANVPTGATTGPISVIGPGGEFDTVSSFTVNSGGGGGGGGGGGTPDVELQTTSGSTAPSTDTTISYRIDANGAFSSPQNVCVFSDDGSGGPIDINGDLSSPGASYDPSTYPSWETISVHASSAATGDYPLHVGLCDESAISDVYTLTVSSTPGYDFQLDNHEFTVAAGGTITPNATIAADPGFTGTIDFSYDNTSPDADINVGGPWGQINVPGPDTEGLPITVAGDVAPGDYTVTVGATAEGLGTPEQQLTILVHVTAGLPQATAVVFPTKVAQLDPSQLSVSNGDSFSGSEGFYASIQNNNGITLPAPQITASSDTDPGFTPTLSSWPFGVGPGDDLVNAGDTFAMTDLTGRDGGSVLPNVDLTSNFDATMTPGSIPAGGGDATATFTVTPRANVDDLEVEIDTQGSGFDYGEITDQTYPDLNTEQLVNESTTGGSLEFEIRNPLGGHAYQFTVTVSGTNDGADPVSFQPFALARLGTIVANNNNEDDNVVVPISDLGNNGHVTFQSGTTTDWIAQEMDENEVDFAALSTSGGGGGGGGTPTIDGGVQHSFESTVDGNTDSFDGTVPQTGDENWIASISNDSSDPSLSLANPTITALGSSGQTFDPSITFPDSQTQDTLDPGDQMSLDDLASSVVHDSPFTSHLSFTRSFETISCDDTDACVDGSSVDYGAGCPAITAPDGTSAGHTVPTGDSLEIVTVHVTPTAGSLASVILDIGVDGDSLSDAGLSAQLIGCDLSGISDLGTQSGGTDGAHLVMTNEDSTAVFVYQVSNTGATPVELKPMVDLTSSEIGSDSVDTTDTSASLTPAGLGGDVQFADDVPAEWQLENSTSYATYMDDLVNPVVVTAPDGSGTMTAQPGSVQSGSDGNTLTFTYTAGTDNPDDGGLNNGTVTLAVPTGWTAPQVDDSSADGYVTADNGSVDVSGRTITVSGLSMNSGDQLNITYGDTSGGGTGVSAPSGSGVQAFTAQEQSSDSGTLTNLADADQAGVALAAPDGSGTMTASPSAFHVGDTGKTITFTYTADPGGVTQGTVELVVPTDWDSPSTTAGDPGYTKSSKGTVAIGDDGQTIVVTGVTLTSGQTFTITYGAKDSNGPGATPTGAGAEQWETLEQSYDPDGTAETATDIATSPTIAVVAAEGSGSVDAQDQNFNDPPNIPSGSTGNTLTFVYTADDGGLSNGTVNLTVPAGWSAPSTDSTADGAVTIDNLDAGLTVTGQTISVTGLNLNGGDTLTIVYGDTTEGNGAAAPSATGNETWTMAESSTGGTPVNLTAGSPLVIVSAPDGSGAMTASPSGFHVGDTEKTIVFTYTAANGGLANGTVALVVPSDWTPPTTDPGDGHVTASKGTVSIGDDGQTIYVAGLTMSQGQTFTLTYSGATPSGTGAEDWEALEQFSDSDGFHDTITDLAAFPSIAVVAADGSGAVDVQDENFNDPPLIEKGTSGHTLTFTYTADDGGLANGTVALTVPAGWSAPVTGDGDSPNALKAGYTTLDNSGLEDANSTLKTKGQVITVAGLDMNGGDSFTITYGDVSGGGPGVKAPAKTGNPDWTTTEQSLPAPQGKATKLAVQPKAPVVGKPKVTGFAPTTAAIGATITIKGTDLAGVDNPNTGGIAFFDAQLDESDADVTTAVVNAAGTALTVQLPDDIADGKWQVQLTNDGGIGSDPVDSGTSARSSAKLTVVDTANVDTVTPSDAAVGKSIVLAGESLKGTTAVWFTGGPAGSAGTISVKPAKVSATSVTVKVPAGAVTGPVWTVTNGASSNTSDFTVDYVKPVIKTVAPGTVAVTALLTITGSHFTGVQDTDNGGAVSVGGEAIDPSLITWVSDTQIKVPVPADLDPGTAAVVVTNGGGDSAAKNITIVAPTVTAVAPATTKVGKSVTITGTSLKGATLVTFTGGKTAKPTVASNGNSMKVTVPKGAQSGSFQIKVAGVTIDSGSVVLTIS